MATKGMKPCATPWCGTLTHNTYCTACQALRDREYESSRPGASKRGYGARWKKESQAFLARNPWCVHCLRAGRRERATQVDHIKPHKGNQRLMWDKSNWQPLCKSCHSAKTAREDGRFTRRTFLALLPFLGPALGAAGLFLSQDNARNQNPNARNSTEYCIDFMNCDTNAPNIGGYSETIKYQDIVNMYNRIAQAKPLTTQQFIADQAALLMADRGGPAISARCAGRPGARATLSQRKISKIPSKGFGGENGA